MPAAAHFYSAGSSGSRRPSPGPSLGKTVPPDPSGKTQNCANPQISGINSPAPTHTDSMENNFIKCGLAGWSAELCYSSLIARTRDHDKRLMGQTSLYMFPIYGMAAAIGPIRQKLCDRSRLLQKSAVCRGGIYTGLIFLTEYCTGWLLRKTGRCPWDYSQAKLNINGLIRLDFAPFWFVLGLFFEHCTAA